MTLVEILLMHHEGGELRRHDGEGQIRGEGSDGGGGGGIGESGV